jgi:hypothetical protein
LRRLSYTGCLCKPPISPQRAGEDMKKRASAEARQAATNDTAQPMCCRRRSSSGLPQLCTPCSGVNDRRKATIFTDKLKISCRTSCAQSPIGLGRHLERRKDAIETSCGSTRSTRGSSQKVRKRFNRYTEALVGGVHQQPPCTCP